MQTCYNCGKQVPDSTLICPDCGALVRRYTDAPKREAPNPQQQNPNQQNPYQQNPYQQNPYQQNPYQQNPYQQVPVQPLNPDGTPQRVRLFGPVRAWLIILIILSGYMVFSSFLSAVLAANPALLDVMAAQPGMELMEPQINALREILTQPYALYVFIGMLVFYAVKCGCHLWLLLSARRLAFRVSIGLSLAGLAAMLLFGGSLMSILLCLDPIFTWLGLKRFWPWMPK